MGTVPALDGPRTGPALRVWPLLPLLLLALPTLLPLLLLASSWHSLDPGLWAHLREHLLGRLLWNTLGLVFAVGLGTTLLGVSLAWLSAMCEFPGRRWLDWALVLPLAAPTYVLAFVYVGLTDFAGPLQVQWRSWFGADASLPELRSLAGAGLLLSLALYPYVYLLARGAFLGQGASGFEAARTLGLGPWQAFWRVSLPAARPAIVGGLSLALMEALADFGAVAILGVDTFTVAIFRTWFALQSLPTAAQLATLLLLAVALLLLIERLARRGARYVQPARRLPPIQLHGWKAWAASALQLSVLGCAFVLPVAQLLVWALGPDGLPLARFRAQIGNSLLLAAMAASLVVLLATALVLLERQRAAGRLGRGLGFVATLGYAVPGTVLAVGVMLTLVALDGWLAPLFDRLGVDLLLASSLAGVLLALAVRFLRVAHGAIDARFEQIRPHLVESARLLGAGAVRRLWRLHLPLLRPGLVAAGLLVFVDVMKELPATLMLRPFGWDTLAVRIYAFTSEGQWAEAATPALLLVAAGLVPVYALFRGAGAR